MKTIGISRIEALQMRMQNIKVETLRESIQDTKMETLDTMGNSLRLISKFDLNI